MRVKLLLLLVFFPELDLITVNYKHSANTGQTILCWHNPINISVLDTKNSLYHTGGVLHEAKAFMCYLYIMKCKTAQGRTQFGPEFNLIKQLFFLRFHCETDFSLITSPTLATFFLLYLDFIELFFYFYSDLLLSYRERTKRLVCYLTFQLSLTYICLGVKKVEEKREMSKMNNKWHINRSRFSVICYP